MSSTLTSLACPASPSTPPTACRAGSSTWSSCCTRRPAAATPPRSTSRPGAFACSPPGTGRHACIVVARAGIPELLDAHPSTEPVHLNVPVKFPDGWEAHQSIMSHLQQWKVKAP